MKRSPLERITLVALCLAPFAMMATPMLLDTFASEPDGGSMGPSATTVAPQRPAPPQAQAGNAPPQDGSIQATLNLAKTILGDLATPRSTETVTVHEPRLSIYDGPGPCRNDGQPDPMCRAAYRDARLQSERSSDIFDDLDACEHRYGENACYERRLRTAFGSGESLYMPIMAGFAMVTDGNSVLSRPIYRCPPHIRSGRDCRQTETGIVLPNRIINRPVTLHQFEQDYTGYMLRQTVRETTYEGGNAFVFVRTAANLREGPR